MSDITIVRNNSSNQLPKLTDENGQLHCRFLDHVIDCYKPAPLASMLIGDRVDSRESQLSEQRTCELPTGDQLHHRRQRRTVRADRAGN